MSLFQELKRRNVIRVSVAYIVATWLLMQMVDVMGPVFEVPLWAPKLVFLILAVGFIPVVIFSWAFEMTPEGIKREADVTRNESITNITAKKLDYVTIALVIGAIGIIAVDRFMPEKGSEPFSPPVEVVQESSDEEKRALTPFPPEQAELPPAKSIAVLPFVNMSDDASNEYFSDGISEEILNALAKVQDLKVAGRTSSFAFKGKNQDLREIGTALNVSHILEGSVRKAGDKVRITAQLIKVDDGYHVWSENYDRELTDVFAIQDEISTAILNELKAKLLGGEVSAVARTDARAYDLYLLASQRIYERNQASLQMAADLLQQAIGIDSTYAPAYAQLGIATLLLSETNYGDLPHAESGKQAKRYLDRALELDSRQAEAMAGMGLYYYDHTLDSDSAIEWLGKSLAINPNLVNANLWLSTGLVERGEMRRALSVLEQSFARDPLHPPTFNNLSMFYSGNGQEEKARSMLTDLSRYLPGDAGLIASIGKVESFAGNWAEADRLLTQAVEREPLNWTDRHWLSNAAFNTMQYERVAEMGTDPVKARALNALGRTEEALILSAAWVSKGNEPQSYFAILAENGRYEELVSILEAQWPDLDILEKEFPNRDGYGASLFGYIAQAYARIGNQTRFDDAMSRFNAALDWQVDQGANNFVLNSSRAHHAILSGDQDGAISLLKLAVEQGFLPRFSLSSEWSAFSPLRGDPRFEAILAQIQDHLDKERTELGLERVSI